jgi:chitinase
MGKTAYASVTIQAGPSDPSPDRAPALSTIGNKTANAGQLLSFAVSATDPDGDSLYYSASKG